MRLEPRIERLEARMPDDTPSVNEIVLVGIGEHGEVLSRAVSYAENGQWTKFAQGMTR